MVKLEEVEDQHFREEQTGPGPKKGDPTLAGAEDEDDDFTDTDSEISTTSLDDDPNSLASETLSDRILALKDMIPPQTRSRITRTTSNLASFTKSSLLFSGKAMWIVSTSVMLIMVPFAIASEEEKMIAEQEREAQMLAGAGQGMLTPGAPGATTPQGQQGAKPAL